MRSDDSILLDHLTFLYGTEAGRAAYERLALLLERYAPLLANTPAKTHTHALTERDAILITYGDQVRSPNVHPLKTIADLCNRHLSGLVSGVHILPFFPYSSDDGFSVIDYRTVDPALGDWDDIGAFGEHFRLMFDAVINHVSAESSWFQQFLKDDPRYRDWFIVVPDGADVARVVRPRALPLLSRFSTPSGDKNVWTTFSADQIDLNYHNPDVLLEVVDTLLYYVMCSAEFIRLDAIAFLWKEYGTTCLHLPQTHRIVQLLRAVLDRVAPSVMLITETNVPHSDNLSYFGNGSNEAQLVYNFALPPLVLHTFHTGDARALCQWASSLVLPSDQVTFFNFLASHDGIGLNPVRGILSDAEIDALVARAQAHGGLVSVKQIPDGSTSPYELNINYFDALSNPQSGEPLEMQVDRFIAAQSIMLVLAGVPGIYFHSLFGSRGWPEGVAQTGQKRTINRQKLDSATLERELADPGSLRRRVFSRYAQLLRTRASHPAFDPHGSMRVLDAGPSIFAVLRTAPNASESVLCLHNVTAYPQAVDPGLWEMASLGSSPLHDLLTDRAFHPGQQLQLTPYQVAWLQTLT